MHRTASASTLAPALALALTLATLTGCAGDAGQTTTTQPTPSAYWSFSPPLASPTVTPGTPPPSATPSLPSSAAPTVQVPAGYLGSWNLDKAACGTESEGRLTIEPGRITFYESAGPITAVLVDGEVVTIKATLTGEGTTWEQTTRFSLSADGRQLTDLSTNALRFRCP